MTPDSQNNSEQKQQCRGIIIPDLKVYYRVIVIKTITVIQKQTFRPIEQNQRPKHEYK